MLLGRSTPLGGFGPKPSGHTGRVSAPPGLDARTDEGAADPAGEPSAVDRTRAAGRETLAAVKEHRTPLLAAGVAFYFFLALVPTLAVAVAIYGFFANPADVRRLVHDALGAAPHEVRNLVTSQLESVSRDSGAATA